MIKQKLVSKEGRQKKQKYKPGSFEIWCAGKALWTPLIARKMNK